MTHGARPRASPLMPMDSGLWSGLSTWATTTRTAQATTRAAASAASRLHGASLQEPGRRAAGPAGARGATTPRARRRWTRAALPPIIPTMDVRAQWYDVIASASRGAASTAAPCRPSSASSSRCSATAPARRPGRPTRPPSSRGRDGAGSRLPRRRPGTALFTGLIGGYGKVTGTPLAAAFVGRAPSGGDVPDDVQAAAGYLGEGLHPRGHAPRARHVLDRRVVRPRRRRRPGGPGARRAGGRGHAPGLSHVAAGRAASACCAPWSRRRRASASRRSRRASSTATGRSGRSRPCRPPGWRPSGANRQPWRFRLDGDSLVLGRAEKLYWTAPIDFGIARLHVELGAQHEGVSGTWTMLAEPRRRPVHARGLTGRSRTSATSPPAPPRRTSRAAVPRCSVSRTAPAAAR